jgi:hypothetical protein
VKGYSNIENLSPLIKRLEKRILDLEKVLTIKDDDSSENKENLTVVSLRKHSSVFVKTESKSEFA